MKTLRLLISAALLTALAACEETPSTSVHDSINDSFYAKFSPGDGVIPFPNNLLFAGTTDGTLEIPITGLTGGELDLVNALNSMDGFSSVAPIATNFSAAIDSSTLTVGTTVRVFEVTLSGTGGAVTSVASELTAADFVATVSTADGSDVNNPEPGANKLVITPLKPLKASTSYAVVLTNGIKDKNGNKAAADLVYTFTKNETTLINAPATSQGDVEYPGLLLGFDADGSGLPLDAGEEAVAVASINSLEGVRQLTKFTEDAIVAAATPAITKPEIILSWVFTTQSSALSADHVLLQAKAQVPADPVNNINSTATPVSTGGPGYADFHVGTLDIPYYLAAIDDPDYTSGDGPEKGHWENSGGNGSFTTPVDRAPVAQSTQTIPVLISVPNASAPACANDVVTCKGSGWPVVIFQHGITQDRTSMLAFADSLAARGIAAVAIDLPMHGITPADPFSIRAATSTYDGAAQERTFDVDYVDNTTGLSGADFLTDESGANFINLPNMMTTRDNLYQSIADLFVLAKSLAVSGTGTGLDYTGDGNGDFDPAKIYFMGHSLGAIVGTSFLAIEASDADGVDIRDAVLAMPGGGVAKLLDGSASFGPLIASGLMVNGVNKGSAEYESFIASAQMMIDAGDPINYAAELASGTEGLLLFEVVGNGGTNKSDLVIPNAVPDDNDTASTIAAPLSGTDPLVTNLSLTQYSEATTGTNLRAVVKFSAGHHGSFLTPNFADGSSNTDDTTAEYKAFVEMQTEAASFIENDGNVISVTGSVADVVQAVP